MNIREAQLKIAVILAHLERDTGSLVKDIGIEALDVTKFSDANRQELLAVKITIERAPGHNWEA